MALASQPLSPPLMQPNGGPDCVCVNIGEKLDRLSHLPLECRIFIVHEHLRGVNEKAYEPDIVAIGPYHRDKVHLQMMEKHKLRYMQLLLQRINEANVEKFVFAIRPLVEEACRCYAEPINLNANQVIEMLILDGCFIIELMQKFSMLRLRERSDPIFKMDWVVNRLQRDLMLFENQLPFSILCKLFDVIEGPDNHSKLICLAWLFFKGLLPDRVHSNLIDDNSHYSHLLGLIHNNWVHSEPNKDESNREENWHFIPNATELREAGVKLVMVEGVKSFDIKFESGEMQIPSLIMEDRTESLLRNLIAYEQYCVDNRLSYVTDYVKVLDCLIQSPKDVEILRRCEIIDNWLGGDEVVANLFNKISDSVTGPGQHFRYADMFRKVNEHCKKRRNRWMANLNRNYLNSPWALISVLTALALLLLTLTQTIFTAFPIKL